MKVFCFVFSLSLCAVGILVILLTKEARKPSYLGAVTITFTEGLQCQTLCALDSLYPLSHKSPTTEML